MLAGDGPSFCAGADVEWQRSRSRRLYRMLESIFNCPTPVVARKRRPAAWLG